VYIELSVSTECVKKIYIVLTMWGLLILSAASVLWVINLYRVCKEDT
jgi:hypothetical protein